MPSSKSRMTAPARRSISDGGRALYTLRLFVLIAILALLSAFSLSSPFAGTASAQGGQPPTSADAGEDQTVAAGAEVTLICASVGGGGPTTTTSWTQNSGAAFIVALTVSGNTATFTAPPAAATLTFTCTITHGSTVLTDEVTVTVTAAQTNRAPTAVASTVAGGTTVNGGSRAWLYAGDSTDPDGDTLTYSWSQTAGSPTVTITAQATSPAWSYFTAPGATTAAAPLTFQLTATDPDGLSDTDTITVTVRAAVTGGPVTNVAAAPVPNTSSQIEVTWDALTGAQTYWVQWKSGAQEYDAALRNAEVAAPSTSHTIYALSEGTQYTVRVIALDTDGHAFQPSAGATASTPALPAGWESPPGPVLSALQLSALKPDRLQLSWTVVSGADAYYVQWKSGTQGYDASRQRVLAQDRCSTNTCALTIDGLDPETAYTFRVMAVKGSFDDATNVFTASSDPSQPSPELAVTTPAWPVAAPANLAATGDTGTAILVTWDAVAALEVGEDQYLLQWRLSSETDADYDVDREVIVTATAAPSYTITGLTPNTAYTVRVRARADLNGDDIIEAESPFTVATATTLATGETAPPAQVTGVTWIRGSIQTNQFGIGWGITANANGFIVQWKSGDQEFSGTERRHEIDCGSNCRAVENREYTITGLTSGTRYTVRVTATRTGAANGTPSHTVTFTTLVDMPQGLQVTPGIGELKVAWNEVARAIGYRVQWLAGSEDFEQDPPAHQEITLTLSPDLFLHLPQTFTPSYTMVGDPPIKRFTFTIETGNPGVPHAVRVAAVTPGANQRLSAFAGPLSAAPWALPGPPRNLNLTPDDGELTVTWDPPDTGYPPVDLYQVSYRPAGAATWRSGLRVPTLAVIDGLINGQSYEVRITAYNRAGSTAAPIITGTPDPSPPAFDPGKPRVPGTPRNLKLIPGDGKVYVEWDAPADVGGPPLYEYWVYYREGSSGDWIGGVNKRVKRTSVTIERMKNGQPYQFRVAARNSRGAGRSTPPQTATPNKPGPNDPQLPSDPDRPPSAPRNLLLTPGDEQIEVSWDEPEDLGKPEMDHYYVGFRAVGGNEWRYTEHRDGAGTRTTIKWLQNGVEYEVQVMVFNVNGRAIAGPRRATPGAQDAGGAGAVPALPAPALTATPGGSTVALSWTSVAGAARYQLWVWTEDDEWQRLDDGSLTGTSYTHSGLTPGTTYFYAVGAVNAVGALGAWSEYAPATVGAEPALPAPVLSATPAGSAIDLSWTPVSGAVRYELLTLWASDPGLQRLDDGSLTGTSYTHSGLTPGTTYFYTVRAVDAAGALGAWSEYAPATVSAVGGQGNSQDGEQEGEEESEPSDTPTPTPVPSEPDRLPSAPRNLNAVQNGDWIDVSWSAPADEGNPPFDGYEVHHRFRTASGWSVWIEGLKWSRSTTGVKVGVRDDQAEFEIRVRAVNGAGKGPFAGPVSVTID